MLNPIDANAVIRHGGAVGRFPGEIHEGVAWWMGACFVAVSGTSRLVVSYDGGATTEEFRRRFHSGAMNSQHWACLVSDLGVADEDLLKLAMKELGGIPGAYLTSTSIEDRVIVSIRLYDADGNQLEEETGISRIREMIADDHVPIPVNEAAKGQVEDRGDLVAGLEARS
ncbi:hypothetical protein [Streptomyces sp. NBC_01481]|uniref:hypothetical protein n=1 Tax=Streptomyces sp. NBC_01481 TaxID=2975869 RepID=UPI002254C777|nr:hypothetical protein [Streptomyces sp. NBC_01481]MCX4584698.1 hypothetical protein [Streptomyces sp. NBC_01481]